MPTIDSWEDENWSEYTITKPSVGTPDVGVDPALGSTGSYSGYLEYFVSVALIKDVFAYSTSGLNAYPIQGREFRCKVEGYGSSPDANVLWGGPDKDNCLFFEIIISTDEIRLGERNDGSETILSSTQTATSKNTVHDVSINWKSNGDITVDFDNGKAQLTGSSSYDSTGFGFYVRGTDEGARIDNAFRVPEPPSAPSDLQLTVE